MRNNVYSVYDQKAKVFCQPFCSLNDETALRAFAYSANDTSTEIGRYPSDFDLYNLGFFDDQTGKFDLQDAVHLSSALQLIEVK